MLGGGHVPKVPPSDPHDHETSQHAFQPRCVFSHAGPFISDPGQPIRSGRGRPLSKDKLAQNKHQVIAKGPRRRRIQVFAGACREVVLGAARTKVFFAVRLRAAAVVMAPRKNRVRIKKLDLFPLGKKSAG